MTDDTDDKIAMLIAYMTAYGEHSNRLTRVGSLSPELRAKDCDVMASHAVRNMQTTLQDPKSFLREMLEE